MGAGLGLEVAGLVEVVIYCSLLQRDKDVMSYSSVFYTEAF